MSDRYHLTIDVNKVKPIQDVGTLAAFFLHLEDLAEVRLRRDYEFEPNTTKILQLHSSTNEMYQASPLEDVPDVFKYASMHLIVTHHSGEDITAIIEHQTGAVNRIETDRFTLDINGPDKSSVDKYLLRAFTSIEEKRALAKEYNVQR